jgi:hypothetical protein
VSLDTTPAEPSPDNPLRGSCLCGGVRFEVTAPFRWANHCHCSRCRKHSGAFGGTQGRVGSSLFGAEWPEGEDVAIRLGSLDGDPSIRPQFHTFVASRAPWDELPDDGLPRYDEGHP